MRFSIRILAALAVALPVTLSNAPANAVPYDPYPWCADYSAGNPNQFYNPGPTGRTQLKAPLDP
jgi:hypothetical protein